MEAKRCVCNVREEGERQKDFIKSQRITIWLSMPTEFQAIIEDIKRNGKEAELLFKKAFFPLINGYIYQFSAFSMLR